jgi:hypothetical protein
MYGTLPHQIFPILVHVWCESQRFHLSFGQILANFTQIFETLWLIGFRLFDALEILPMSYFKIVFSVVHRFYINILPNCAIAGRELVFGMRAEMLSYQLKWTQGTEKRSADDRPINLRRSPVSPMEDCQKSSL